MATFTDTKGRSWQVDINVNAVKRVRNILDIDLLDIGAGSLWQKLIGDPVILCDILYVLCKPEADSRSVSDEEFGRSLGGDTLDEATKALTEALVNFFPGRKAKLLKKAMEKLETLQAKTMDLAEAELESGQLDEVLKKEFQRLKSGDISTGVQGS